MNSEEDFFIKQMRGVKPLKKNNRVIKENSVPKKKTLQKSQTTKTKKEIKKLIKPTQQPGFDLQKINLKKSIKKGFFKINKKVDFHGLSLLESEEIFITTISQCYEKGLRCLLFITGKGLYKSTHHQNEESPKLYHGVIRSAFTDWVKSKKLSKFILSYENASIEHGGDGAFYVYLRKKK